MKRSIGHTWRKYGLLLAGVVAVVLIRQWLNRIAFDPTHDTFDAKLFFAFSIVASISALIMLADTERWTIRAVGVLGLLVFSGLIYGLTTQYVIWQWHEPTQHDFNWFRAVILLSAPLLFISQVRYLTGRFVGWIQTRGTLEQDQAVEQAHQDGVREGQENAADAMGVPIVNAPVFVVASPPKEEQT